MPRTKKTLKDELELPLRRSSRNKQPDITPVKPKFVTASTASTASSSSSSSGSGSGSSASSLFDHVATNLDTPLSTPISEDSSSSDEKGLNVTNNGKFVPSSNVLKPSKPLGTSVPKRSSPAVKSSKSLIRPKPFVLLSRLDDDGLSGRLRGLRLEDPPSPASRASGRRKSRLAAEENLDSFKLGARSSQLHGKGEARDVMPSSEATSWREKDISLDSDTDASKDLQSSNPGKITPGSSKEKKSKAPPSNTIQIGDESEEATKSSSSSNDSDSPVIEEHGEEKAALSKPRKSHIRLKSATTYRDEIPASLASLSRSAATKVPESTQDSPESHKLRRRSTGSLDAAGGASSTSVDALLVDGEPLAKGRRAKPTKSPTTRRRTASTIRPKTIMNTEQVYPNLEGYATFKMDQESLMPKILEAIRGKPVSKYDRLRAIRVSFDNMWKTWVDISKKPPRTPAVEEDGYIYIFRSKPDAFPGKKYVKIGKTQQTPEKRKRQWEQGCKFEFIHIEDKKDKRFLYYHAVERIIKAELYNERRKYKCNKCGKRHDLELGQDSVRSTKTEHGEWFEVSEEKALEVVNKWRDWVIENKPYKPDGSLRARWLWKCTAGSFWMNGTEDDWIDWRKFGSVDTFRCLLNHLMKWLGGVVPPMIEVLMAPGAIFGLALVWYFSAWGFTFGSCVAFLATVFVLVYFWFVLY
jgi:T5orf172 domain